MKYKNLLAIVCMVLLFIAIIWWLFPKNQNNYTPQQHSNAIQKAQTIAKNIDSKNPIGITPKTAEKIKVDKFQPNFMWKDKEIYFKGKKLIYRFGEGNPPETALAPKDYLAKGEQDGIPYVTPITERKLQDFLSDKDLPEILDKCENYNRQEMARLNPKLPISQLPILIQPSDFDIDNILIINDENGRKEINQSIVNQMNEFFTLLNNPLAGSEFSDKCAGIAYKDTVQRIQNKFSEFTKSYVNTGEAIPSSAWLK